MTYGAQIDLLRERGFSVFVCFCGRMLHHARCATCGYRRPDARLIVPAQEDYDDIEFAVSHEQVFVPDGFTARMPDGTLVDGPTFVVSPMVWRIVD